MTASETGETTRRMLRRTPKGKAAWDKEREAAQTLINHGVDTLYQNTDSSAVVQLAEPVIFGRMVDRLAEGAGAFALIGLWAAFGLIGIGSSAVLAIASDRLAHRAPC